jgi:hypothetical protein
VNDGVAVGSVAEGDDVVAAGDHPVAEVDAQEALVHALLQELKNMKDIGNLH